ncbi:MAG TPA: hypothetical protein P5089_01165 [Candidatus Portnoybacteria bacterium]|nr:hypothetical protein [Candidatus Portnoybacteria bacterium]
MACFIAPAAAAIAATAIKKRMPSCWHFGKLTLMLWGGVLMLLVDHAATGEIIPYFPFFTRSWNEIWPEIIKIGLPMTLLIFAVWGGIILYSNFKNKPVILENK